MKVSQGSIGIDTLSFARASRRAACDEVANLRNHIGRMISEDVDGLASFHAEGAKELCTKVNGAKRYGWLSSLVYCVILVTLEVSREEVFTGQLDAGYIPPRWSMTPFRCGKQSQQ